jgi:hypothetical protein
MQRHSLDLHSRTDSLAQHRVLLRPGHNQQESDRGKG